MLKKKLIRGLAIGLCVFSLTLVLFLMDAFQTLEWKAWDLRLRLFSDPSQASQDVVLVLINQESLDVYAKEQSLSWPWPRQIYIPIIKFCNQGGARAVVFDFIFSESSSWGVEDDQIFARALTETGNVFLPVFLSREQKDVPEDSWDIFVGYAAKAEEYPGRAVVSMISATLPIPSLLSAAKGVGNVQFPPDGDGIFRRFPLFFSLKDKVYPALPLAVTGFAKENFIDSVPLDKSGQMIIRYHGPTGSYQTFSAAAVINSFALQESGLSPQISAAVFKDKIVLVGASAPGLLDLKPTPFSPVFPGTEVHATAIDNLINQDFVRFPAASISLLLLLGISLLAGLGTSVIQKTWLSVLFVVLCIAVPAVAAWVGFLADFWVEFVALEFSVLLSFVAATVMNFSVEGRRRRFIKRVFTHYLSPHVIERVIQDPTLLRLGGERREVTSFFSDVAGFTSISERLSPEELVNLLNAYLSEMTDIILSHGGTLDKYEGDAIIAFWNAPLDHPDHALRASRAALECQSRLLELKPHFLDEFGADLSTRIGINSGPVVVGNMGSHQRFDYTAMGDTINLASRLEGACKQYGVKILAGESTYDLVKEAIAVREVDFIRVVGKKNPVRVYEIIGVSTELTSTQLEAVQLFQRILSAYRNREWDRALELCRELEDDALKNLYLKRIQDFKESPPSVDWDGVYELTKK